MKKPEAELRNVVSDHAVVRYMERVLEINPDAIREAIISGNLALVQKVFNGEIKSFQKRIRLVVRGGVVVTVLPLESSSWKPKRARGEKKCRLD